MNGLVPALSLGEGGITNFTGDHAQQPKAWSLHLSTFFLSTVSHEPSPHLLHAYGSDAKIEKRKKENVKKIDKIWNKILKKVIYKAFEFKFCTKFCKTFVEKIRNNISRENYQYKKFVTKTSEQKISNNFEEKILSTNMKILLNFLKKLLGKTF
jgi:membrane-associated HD superfamily phosphohydrolase